MSVDWSELDSIVLNRGNLTKFFSALKPLAKMPIDRGRLESVIDYFKFKDQGLAAGSKIQTQPDEIYGGHYPTYHSWFTRNLRPEVLSQIKAAAGNSSVVIPNECAIESVGVVGDTSSILRLKQPAERAKHDLAELGVPASHCFVNMKLLTSHYHHIHSPVSGRINRSVPIHADYPMFGRASVNFVEIDSPIGAVFILIIGEAVVQDFDYAVSVGDRVDICDDLGNFTWGSQTVMFFPSSVDLIDVKAKQYVFVGDRVI